MDSLNTFLDSSYLTPELYRHLKSILSHQVYTNGEYGEMFSGMLGGVMVRLSGRGVDTIFNVPKYLKGNNQVILTLDEVKAAIEQLGNELMLPLLKARVTRVDHPGNIMCKDKVDQFFRVCGNLRGYRRLEQSSGLNYAQNRRGRYITFYDKVKEVKTKKDVLIDPFKDKNIVRYEIRWMSHEILAKDLGLTEVTVQDLLDHYDVIINIWISTFLKIVKEHDVITFTSEAFNVPGALDKQILIQGVKSIGGLPVVLNAIKVAKDRGDFGYGNKSTNLKRKYTDLMTHPILTVKSDISKEVEDKVKALGFVMSCPLVAKQLING